MKMILLSLSLCVYISAQETSEKPIQKGPDITEKIVSILQKGSYRERSKAIKLINSLDEKKLKKVKKALSESKDPELQRIYNVLSDNEKNKQDKKVDINLLMQDIVPHFKINGTLTEIFDSINAMQNNKLKIEFHTDINLEKTHLCRDQPLENMKLCEIIEFICECVQLQYKIEYNKVIISERIPLFP